MIAGGEWLVGTNNSTVDIYDPVSDTWTSGSDMPAPVGDTAASILDDGRVLVSSVWKNEEFIYDASTNTWNPPVGPGKTLGTGTSGDEKGWTLLPNGTLLDAFDTWSIYTPGTDSWSGPQAFPSGISLISGGEIGPMSLLHSGKVVQFGSAPSGVAAQTAIFDGSTWTRGPDAPDGLQFGDHPAAVMPNGHVLCVTGSSPSGGNISAYWDFNPFATPLPTLTQVTNTIFGTTALPLLLVLPTGQVLVAPLGPAGTPWALFTPTGGPMPSWRPTIATISGPTSAGEFTLTGTNLNGLTTGASFGDDNNMATNYPIVSLVDGSGHKYYARSYGYDHMAPGTATSTKFTLPPNIPNIPTGTAYAVHVSASGVDSSNTQSLIVSGTHVTQLFGGATSVTPGSSTSWRVSISTVAPTITGIKVNLSSSNTNVATVPASVVIPRGASQTGFQLTSRGFGRAIISAQTATPNSQFKPATRAFGWTVSSVMPSQNSFVETVTISDLAPTGGVVVNLSANMPNVSLPSTVTIPAGSNQATFSVSTTADPSLAVVNASLSNSSRGGFLTSLKDNFYDKRWAWTQGFWF
jgi:Kelch motif protein